MNVSVKWLSQLVDLSDISVQALADKLTNAGIEVESVTPLVSQTHCVIGHVLTCEDHPNSDHLHITTVDVGDEVLNIVCGAANIVANQKVIVAKIGAQIKDLVIQPVMLRNQKSHGMICSYQELGLPDKFIPADQANGIAVLDQEAPIGASIYEYMGWDDEILDVAQTPNRNDVMAMHNLAYEVGALFDTQVMIPNPKQIEGTGDTPLIIQSKTDGCPQFLGRIIESITIKESPDWIKEKLMAANIKSINNVVDISNLVMLETGQPLHFYDRQKIVDEITVKDGYELDFVALDEETYRILPEDLCITSNNQVVGLAGIMGSEQSKIDENTTSIIIEVAHFDRVQIRQTSRRLNLISDAATRFIKGIDPQAATYAIARATDLLLQLADAQGIHKVVSIKPQETINRQVSVSVAEIHALLGVKIEVDVIMDVFERLQFEPTIHQGLITCTIPSYRLDLAIGADLIEEVIRVVGYDVLPMTPLKLAETAGRLDQKQQLHRKLQQILMGFGLQEVVTYTLVNPSYQKGPYPLENPMVILSPLSEDRKMVRNQLFRSCINVVSYNQSYKNKPNNFFELSEVYGKDTQQWRLCIIISDPLVDSSWQQQAIAANFYTLKGMIEQVVLQMGINKPLKFKPVDTIQTWLHPHQSANVFLDDQLIGYCGAVHPLMAKTLDVKHTWILEVNLDALVAIKKQPVAYQTVFKYPKVEKDLAFVLAKSTSIDHLRQTIKEASTYIEQVDVFDVFENEKLGEDKHSIALNLQFVANQMYTDDMISSILKDVIESVKNKCEGEIRL